MMDDLDQRLHEAGRAFRATHERPADARISRVGRPRRRGILLPVVAAAVTAGLVVAVAAVRPAGKPAPPAALATGGPVRTAPRSFALTATGLTDVELGDRTVAVASGGSGQGHAGRLEVYRRDDPTTVLYRTRTAYAAGDIRCVHLDGDWVLWADQEVVRSDYTPGPAGRVALRAYNLVTGEQRTLADERPALDGQGPCPVGAAGTAAWSTDGSHVTVLDLASGRTRTVAARGRLSAVLPSGLILSRHNDDGTMDVVLRSLVTGQERIVRSVRGGVEVEGFGDRLVWFERDPASDSADAGIVRTCELPACATARTLARDPSSSWGVVGSTFAVWSGLHESPSVTVFSGAPAPALAPGPVPFFATSANGDTLAYCTVVDEGDRETVTLHLLAVP
jgi:hypothetical protein